MHLLVPVMPDPERGCCLQVFAKADPRVAEYYEKELVDKELWDFGKDLRR